MIFKKIFRDYFIIFLAKTFLLIASDIFMFIRLHILSSQGLLIVLSLLKVIKAEDIECLPPGRKFIALSFCQGTFAAYPRCAPVFHVFLDNAPLKKLLLDVFPSGCYKYLYYRIINIS